MNARYLVTASYLRAPLIRAAFALALLGCTREQQPDRREGLPESSARADDLKSGAARGQSGPAPNHTQVTPWAAGAPSSEPTLARPGGSTFPPIDRAEFARLLADLSEPDGKFISDNYVSNETSYLQVADGLSRHVAPGGAYLGVGPEQNFTYIALTRPALAFIIDIRRANLLLHLLYKAAFERARGRAHFLALMLSRPWAERDEPPPVATASDVLAALARSAPTPAQFERNHRELIEQLTKGDGLHFDAADLAQLRRAHEAFLRGQLALAFDLNENSTRRYPTLDELLLSRDPTGSLGGFLHTEEGFRYVQHLQRSNRLIPVVGDFAGSHALSAVAGELTRRGLSVATFYVSNVEQYLLGDSRTWSAWADNLLRLPTSEETLMVRAYLDQGRKHPAQLAGHRTTTVLQPFDSQSRRNVRVRPKSLLSLTEVGWLRE